MQAQSGAIKRRAQSTATRFAEADADGKGEITFEAFVAMQPTAIRQQCHEADMRVWFNSIASRTDVVTAPDFFFFVLYATFFHHGLEGIRTLFDAHASRDGKLDARQFCDILNDMGFGSVAHDVLISIDHDRSGVIQLEELVRAVVEAPCSSKWKSSGDRLAGMEEMARAWAAAPSDLEGAHRMCSYSYVGQEGAMEARRRNANLLGLNEPTWRNVDDSESLRATLSMVLRSSKVSVADLWALFSPDNNGFVDQKSFVETMVDVCGFSGERKLAEQLFAFLDERGSGRITQQGLFELVHKRKSVLRRKSLKSIGALTLQPKNGEQYALDDDDDVPWTEDELRLELQLLLLQNRISPAEMVTAWDKNSDNTLSKKEFLTKMRKLFGASRAFGGWSVRARDPVPLADGRLCLHASCAVGRVR